MRAREWLVMVAMSAALTVLGVWLGYFVPAVSTERLGSPGRGPIDGRESGVFLAHTASA